MKITEKRSVKLTVMMVATALFMLTACKEQSPKVRILNEQNLVDILIGSCIQSTRNCDPSQSIADVKKALAEGKVFTTILSEDVPENEMVVAVQGIGGGGPWQYVIDRTEKQGLAKIENPNISVVELFKQYT